MRARDFFVRFVGVFVRVAGAVILAGLLLCPGAGRAGDFYLSKNVLQVRAGAVCTTPPDSSRKAPGTREGKVDEDNQPYLMARTGATVPALPGIGIGLVFALKSYEPHEPLSIFSDIVATGQSDRFSGRLTADGRFWTGRFPRGGGRLPLGQYRISVLAAGQQVLTFTFTVVPPKPGETAEVLCEALTS